MSNTCQTARAELRLKINSDNAEQVAEINDNIKEFKYAMRTRWLGPDGVARWPGGRVTWWVVLVIAAQVCYTRQEVTTHTCASGTGTLCCQVSEPGSATRTHLSATVCLAAHEVKINF